MSEFFLVTDRLHKRHGHVGKYLNSNLGFICLEMVDGTTCEFESDSLVSIATISNNKFEDLAFHTQMAMFSAFFEHKYDCLFRQHKAERWSKKIINCLMGFQRDRYYQFTMETAKQKEIKEIREQMEVLAKRLKVLEDK